LERPWSGLTLDIRQHPGDPSSSIVVSLKAFNDSGVASVVVENEDLLGSAATIVLFDSENRIISQRKTIVGGGLG